MRAPIGAITVLTLFICSNVGVRGWTGFENEGSGEEAVTTETNTNGETAVNDNNPITEEGYVLDNANGDPPPPEPTAMDFIDPSDFMGPQVY